jgi:TonB-linked SusC/RagA family outer membrane protein
MNRFPSASPVYRDKTSLRPDLVLLYLTRRPERIFISIVQKSFIIAGLLLWAFSGIAQGTNLRPAITVSGTVTVEGAGALPNVSISIKGGAAGTSTDNEGRYVLKVADTAAILVFTSVGYATQERVVGSNNIIDITMTAQVSTLDQVVVIGYGTVKKRDLTGSVASLKGSDLANKPLASISQGMRGKLTGVQVTTLSGAPGAGISIRVRGGSSVSAGMEPLYVIDGIPVYSDQTYISTDPLTNINPSDIESMEVLKDASATAIYGSRGANGVVLVTTRKGKEGRMDVSLNVKAGIQRRAKKLDLLSTDEFWKLADIGFRFSSQFGTIQNPIKDPNLNYANTDWQDEVFQNAPQQSYELSITGGNKQTTYAASLGYFNQEGIVIGSDFKRLSGRLSVDSKLNDNVTIGTNINVSSTARNFIKDVLANAIAMVPFMPVYDKNGKYAFLRDYSAFGTATSNPVALGKNAINKSLSDRVLGTAYLNIKFLRDFSLRISGSADLTNVDNSAYMPNTVEPGRSVNGIATLNSGRLVTLLQESVVSYKKQLSDKHRIDALVGFSSQNNVTITRSSASQTFLTNFFQANNVGSAEKVNSIGSGKTSYTMNSVISRANYSFMDKYMFTATFRADGSSRFGVNNKWGYFPSGAIAWIASDEDFLKNSRAISSLKIRASYGLTGNQEIGLYRSIQRIGSAQVSLADGTSNVGYYTSSIGYPDLSWEKTKQLDLGFDLTLFNTLNVVFDYYDKRTSRVLFEVTAPPSTGYTSYLRNAGAISNKGLELNLNSTVINRRDLKLDFSLNLSRNINKVLDLGGSEQILVPISQGNSLVRRGEPLGIFYGYIFDGTFKTQQEVDNTPWAHEANQQPGLTKLRDIASIDSKGNRVLVPDGYITDADQTIIGDPNPDFTFGFSSSVRWKAFDFGFSLYGSYGNDIFNVIFREAQRFSGNKNVLRSVLNSSIPAYLSPDGVDHLTDIPIPTFTFTGQSKYAGGSYSNNIENGSFLRMSDITVGYTIPLKSNSVIKRVRAYLTVQNLFTITKYTGYDPDVSNQYGRDANYPSVTMGYDADPYPVSRSFNAGVTVNF